jgi:thymidylate synthase ThyX
MSSDKEVEDLQACQQWWEECRQAALTLHQRGEELGVHKQILNRVLEPYQHITALVTATDWDNFFSQRISPKAQPEIRVLAQKVRDALIGSKPQTVHYGEWHMPFLTEREMAGLPLEDRQYLAVSRCARLSYLNHNGVFSPEDDKRLYDLLLSEKHPSPFEHIAEPASGRHGNFNGWKQLRQHVEELWQK